METILEIKDKYSSSTRNVDELKEFICITTLQLEKLIRNDIDRFLEDEKKLDNLKTKIIEQIEQHSIEEKKLNTMQDELANHTEILKELELERNRFFIENSELESKRNQLKVMKPSAKDHKILECGRRKYDYYKVLTGIRWDYPMLKSCVKGLVTNGDDYVHPFKFENTDKRLESKLWREIEKNTINHNNSKRFEHKENSSPNTQENL